MINALIRWARALRGGPATLGHEKTLADAHQQTSERERELHEIERQFRALRLRQSIIRYQRGLDGESR